MVCPRVNRAGDSVPGDEHHILPPARSSQCAGGVFSVVCTDNPLFSLTCVKMTKWTLFTFSCLVLRSINGHHGDNHVLTKKRNFFPNFKIIIFKSSLNKVEVYRQFLLWWRGFYQRVVVLFAALECLENFHKWSIDRQPVAHPIIECCSMDCCFKRV